MSTSRSFGPRGPAPTGAAGVPLDPSNLPLVEIESVDPDVVLLKNTVTQMVYKHASSTVVPARSVNIGADETD
jgi:hypothetical protein